MDLELLIWVLVFVGGYSAILGYLLWVAMRGPRDPGAGVRDPEGGPDRGGPPG